MAAIGSLMTAAMKTSAPEEWILRLRHSFYWLQMTVAKRTTDRERSLQCGDRAPPIAFSRNGHGRFFFLQKTEILGQSTIHEL